MNQPKILVVDDDKEIVGAIKKRLEMEDYEIMTAYDGLEAMDVLMEQEVQLLIIDVMMPKMDGLSATMKIRESKNIPIIILSAKTEESDKILGLSMGGRRRASETDCNRIQDRKPSDEQPGQSIFSR